MSVRTGVRLRAAEARDLPAVMRVERASYSQPWSPAAFRSLLGRTRVRFLVAELEGEGEVVGHGVLWAILDEAELANLAVLPEARGRGVGSALLDRLVDEARAAGARAVFLEVRESNEGARELYSRRGFREVGVRKQYYESPRENARILRLELAEVS